MSNFDSIVKTHYSKQNENSNIFWRGAGYYAPIQHGEIVSYYFVCYKFAKDYQVQEQAKGLGTPRLFLSVDEF